MDRLEWNTLVYRIEALESNADTHLDTIKAAMRRISALEADEVIQDFARRLSQQTREIEALKAQLNNQERLLGDNEHRDQQLRRAIGLLQGRIERLEAEELPVGTTVPVKKSGWANIYRLQQLPYKLKRAGSCIGGVYATREEADKHQRINGDVRVACVPIDWEEPT